MSARRVLTAAAIVAGVTGVVVPVASAESGRALVEIGRLSDGSSTGVDPGALLSGLTVNGGAGAAFGVGAPARFNTNAFTYTPPADTAIEASTAYATAIRAFGWPAMSTYTEIVTSWGQWNVGGSPGDVNLSGTFTSGAAATLTGAVRQTSSGAGTEQDGRFLLDRLTIELTDAVAPALSAAPAADGLFGPPRASGWYTASTLPITVSAGDRGLGVRWLLLREGGGAVRAVALPGLPASCATQDPDASLYGGDSYTADVPCPTAVAEYVVPIDLTALGDGEHTLELGVQDASGRTSYAATTYVVKVNAPGLNPGPGGSPGLADPGTACPNGAYDDSGTCVSRPPSASSPPLLTGLPSVGGALTTDRGTWSDAAGATYGYDWLLCDATGGGCTPIAGEHGATLSLTPAMADHTVRSLVTASTAAGSASVRSAPSYTIAGAGAGGGGGAGGVRDVPAAGASGGGGGGGGGGGARRTTTAADPPTVPPLVVRVASPNGRGATSTARVAAARRGGAIAGRVTTIGGEPIGQAQVDIVVQAATDSHGQVAGAVTTGEDGRFTFPLPANARGRIFTFGYREHLSDDHYAHWTSVAVADPPTLRVDRTLVANGRSVLFRGRATDGVELQVEVRHRWTTIATPRLRNGAFAYRYRFTRTHRTTTYRFRALSPSGPSTTTTVRVTAKEDR